MVDAVKRAAGMERVHVRSSAAAEFAIGSDNGTLAIAGDHTFTVQ